MFPALLDAARKLHDPKAGVSGFVARGLKNANTPVWTSFLLGYGLDAIDRNGRFHTDGPEAIEAARLYQALDRDCAPIGIVGFNWYECQADFMMGRSAMFLDTESVGGIASDPARSHIAAKVGYAMMPAGPKARVAPMFGDGIAAASKKQGAAWLYCQWATNKTSQAQQIAGGSGAPTRSSVYEMVKTLPDRAIPDDWIAAVTESSRIAHPCIPEIVAANEFLDVFGVALSNMLTGADPAEQLHHAMESFRSVLPRAGEPDAITGWRVRPAAVILRGKTKETAMGLTIENRVAALDWPAIKTRLDAAGHAVSGPLLTSAECASIAALYADDVPFRSRVVMARHGYGQGEYRYFAYPLPDPVAALRRAFYPDLAATANRWRVLLGDPGRLPDTLDAFLADCHAAGQTRPTPLLLKYGAGDYNRLHQDLYGERVFPLQITILLSDPAHDFSGGEFVLVEQKPRAQSRAEVVPLRQGEAVIFAVHRRPARGSRGVYRAALRHGVSTVRDGQRFTLGVIFHDAA